MAIDISPIRVEENHELVIFAFLHASIKNHVVFLFDFEENFSKTCVFILKKAGRMFVWGRVSGFAEKKESDRSPTAQLAQKGG